MKEAEYIQFSWFSNEFVNQDIEQIYQGLVGTIADASHKNKDAWSGFANEISEFLKNPGVGNME